MSITNAAMKGYSKERILAEIAKCDVLCANCHIKEHARLESLPPSLDGEEKDVR